MRENAKGATRHEQLQAQLRAGEITDLVPRPRWRIVVAGEFICIIEADFGYRIVKRGTSVAEFVNPRRSALYGLKKKLLKACHGVEVVEVRV